LRRESVPAVYPQHWSWQPVSDQQQTVSQSTSKHISGTHAAAGRAADSKAVPVKSTASNRSLFFFITVSFERAARARSDRTK
jgi:hypothetical protein